MSLKIIKEKPDNHCLFRSFIRNISGKPTKNKIKKIRNILANYIEKEKDKYESFIYDTNFKNYCNLIKNTDKWGGELEILAFSDLYKRNVVIYSKEKKEIIQKYDNNYKYTLYLEYQGRTHYNTITIIPKHLILEYEIKNLKLKINNKNLEINKLKKKNKELSLFNKNLLLY